MDSIISCLIPTVHDLAMDAVTGKYREKSDTFSGLTPDSRSDSQTSERTLFNMSDTELEDRSKSKDLEKDAAHGITAQTPTVITKDHAAPDPLARAKMLMWMAINTLATVFIVRRPSI